MTTKTAPKTSAPDPTTGDPVGDHIVDSMAQMRGAGQVLTPETPLRRSDFEKVRKKDDKEMLIGRDGWLDNRFWANLDGDDNWEAIVPSATALDAFFQTPSRVSAKTAAQAAIAQGLREAMDGDDVFNRRLPHLRIGRAYQPPLSEWMEGRGAKSEGDLIRGDTIPVKNTTKYRRKHPTGIWDEVQAIYAGEGMYEVHGMGRMTMDGIREALAEHYNDAYDEDDRDDRLEAQDAWLARDASLHADTITAADITVDWSQASAVDLLKLKRGG